MACRFMHGAMIQPGHGLCWDRREARAGDLLSFGVVYLARLVTLPVRTARWASHETLIGRATQVDGGKTDATDRRVESKGWRRQDHHDR
jgi:hypothetical protein